MKMLAISILPDHALRQKAEDFIKSVYDDQYGAVPYAFPRLLLAFLDSQGEIVGAAGIRVMNDGFFSECYLDQPVEDLLSIEAKNLVSRDNIFEVSTLVTRTPGAGVQFIEKLIAYGADQNFDWAFFTVTARLRALLGRWGLDTKRLAIADISRVPNPSEWGSYYSYAPVVCAVERGQAAYLLRGRCRAVEHA